MPPVHTADAVSRRAVLLGGVLLIVAVFGGWRAAAALTSGQHDPRALHVGGATFTVTHVEQVAGISDAELGGMSHNIQGLVTDKELLVRVSVTVSAGSAPTTFNPAVLRIYTGGSGGAIAPSGGSFAGGKLAAHGRIEGSLSYVVKRNGARLTLRADGTAGSVPLLQLDNAPAGTGGHDHGTATSEPPSSGPSPPVSSK
jgi:hypothetical protein